MYGDEEEGGYKGTPGPVNDAGVELVGAAVAVGAKRVMLPVPAGYPPPIPGVEGYPAELLVAGGPLF